MPAVVLCRPRTFAAVEKSIRLSADGASRSGMLRMDHGREQKSFAVSGGCPQVVDDTVTVLSESATAA